MNLDKMAGAGGTITLKWPQDCKCSNKEECKECNGTGTVFKNRTFLFRKFTLRDIAQMQAWLRERIASPYEVAAKILKELLPLKESDPEWYAKKRDELIIKAQEAAEGDAFLQNDAIRNRVMLEKGGFEFMIWMGIHRDAPSVTQEQISEAMGVMIEEELDKTIQKVNDAASVEGAEDKNPPKAETSQAVA